MRRWKQYSGFAVALVLAGVAGVYGFFATGGAMPVKKRFHAILEGGAGTSSGGGPLINLERGVVTPGTVDAAGEFVPILLAFIILGIFFFSYAMAKRDTQ
jgi:hypothetical protein